MRPAVLFLAVLISACSQGTVGTIPGTDLGANPAADFRLRDDRGQDVALSDYRGRPVALTFLYTDCPDVCPLTAQRLGQALNQLDDDAGEVAVLVVSVDPDGDTPEKAMEFMAKHGLTGPARHYLLGDESTLAPVWLAYGVGTAALAQGDRGPGGPTQYGRVGHTDATILIDREGRKRSLLRSEATVNEIAAGLRILLR